MIGKCKCHAWWLWYPGAELITEGRPCSNCGSHVVWVEEE